jgi:hypothetical protein
MRYFPKEIALATRPRKTYDQVMPGGNQSANIRVIIRRDHGLASAPNCHEGENEDGKQRKI